MEVRGWAERSGVRVGRFLGVTSIVMVRPWRASWWVRSRIGSMWPWAGYGNHQDVGVLRNRHGFCFLRGCGVKSGKIHLRLYLVSNKMRLVGCCGHRFDNSVGIVCLFSFLLNIHQQV